MAKELTLTFRSREISEDGSAKVKDETRAWLVAETAVVICDMWDKHWCGDATARVAEMAPHMNEVVKTLRAKGVLIVHAPSATMEFYKEYPGRKMVQTAPRTEVELGPAAAEPKHPLEVINWGCFCQPPCAMNEPWTRQIATIEIADEDGIGDDDQVYDFMRQRGVRNMIIMGVHTNMCVLNRPFGIRRMLRRGINVVLMRDMTDAAYSPEGKPNVSHFEGNDILVGHIETYLCPTVTSDQVIGGEPFRFKSENRNEPSVGRRFSFSGG